MPLSRREFLKLGATLPVVACFKPQHRKYDYNDNFVSFDTINKILNSTKLMKIKYKFVKDGELQEFDGYTNGTLIGKNKYLTVSHAVYLDDDLRKSQILTPFGVYEMESEDFKVLERQYSIDEKPARMIYRSAIDDLALFETEEMYDEYAKIGNSDDLYYGNLLIIPGTPYGENIKLRTSHVSNLNMPEEVNIEDKGLTDIPRDQYFMFYIADYGDSGSGVYALDKGDPELVGVIEFKFYSMGGAIKINHVLRKIKDLI